MENDTPADKPERGSKKKAKRSPSSKAEFTQIEKDLCGLETLNGLQLQLIHNVESTVEQLKTTLETRG